MVPVHQLTVLSPLLMLDPIGPGMSWYDVNPDGGSFITNKRGNPKHCTSIRAHVEFSPSKTPYALQAMLLELFIAASKQAGTYTLVGNWGDIEIGDAVSIGNYVVITEDEPEYLGRLCWDVREKTMYGAMIFEPKKVIVTRVRSQVPRLLRELRKAKKDLGPD